MKPGKGFGREAVPAREPDVSTRTPALRLVVSYLNCCVDLGGFLVNTVFGPALSLWAECTFFNPRTNRGRRSAAQHVPCVVPVCFLRRVRASPRLDRISYLRPSAGVVLTSPHFTCSVYCSVPPVSASLSFRPSVRLSKTEVATSWRFCISGYCRWKRNVEISKEDSYTSCRCGCCY